MELTERELQLLTTILGLDGQDVVGFEVREATHELHLTLGDPEPPWECPHCGRVATSLHDRSERVVRDKPWADHDVFLHVPVFRIRCCRGRTPIQLPLKPNVKKNTTVKPDGSG